jgi:hypothetical protein
MAQNRHFVTGAKAIAAEFECSAATVLRNINAKVWPAFKTGRKSSPWKMWRKDIDGLRTADRQVAR